MGFMINKKVREVAKIFIAGFQLQLFMLITITPQEIKILNFASYGNIFVEINKSDVDAALTVLVNTFQTKIMEDYNISYVFEHMTYTNLENVKKDLDANKIDCIGLSVFDYLELNSFEQLEPYFAGSIDEDAFKQFILIAHKDAGFETLSDVEGSEIFIPHFNHSKLIDVWLLTQINKFKKVTSFEEYFSKVTELENEAKIIIEVFFKKKMVGIISNEALQTAVALNPQIEKNLIVVARSDKIIPDMFAFSKKLDTYTKDLIGRTALTLHESKEGRQILNLFKINSLFRINDAELANVKAMYNVYKKIVSRN